VQTAAAFPTCPRKWEFFSRPAARSGLAVSEIRAPRATLTRSVQSRRVALAEPVPLPEGPSRQDQGIGLQFVRSAALWGEFSAAEPPAISGCCDSVSMPEGPPRAARPSRVALPRTPLRFRTISPYTSEPAETRVAAPHVKDAAGDHGQKRFFRKYGKRLYTIAWRMLGNEAAC